MPIRPWGGIYKKAWPDSRTPKEASGQLQAFRLLPLADPSFVCLEAFWIRFARRKLSSAPIIIVIALKYSQRSRTITAPMEPYTTE